MKRNRNIQIFTKGNSEYCEVNAELVEFNENRTGTAIHVITKEEDGSIWEYFFPLHNIQMVRITK